MPAPHTDMVGKKVNRVAEVQTGQRTHERKNIGGLRLWSGRKVGTPAGRYQVTYHEITLPLQKTKTVTVYINSLYFLVHDQRDTQLFSMYSFLFLTLYMFRAHRANHQER